MINVHSLLSSTPSQSSGVTKIGQSTVSQPITEQSLAFGQYVQVSNAQPSFSQTDSEETIEPTIEHQQESSEVVAHSIGLFGLPEAQGDGHANVHPLNGFGSSQPETQNMTGLTPTSEALQKLATERNIDSSSLPKVGTLTLEPKMLTPHNVTASHRSDQHSFKKEILSNNQQVQVNNLQTLSQASAKPVSIENPTQIVSNNNPQSAFVASTLISNAQPAELNHVSNIPTPKLQSGGTEWASMQIDTKAGKWGEQMMQVLHDRVTLQAQQNMQEAKIRLDPPELGKLDLLVRVEGDRLNVQINANAAATREALVQISERLRAELQQQNFVHVDVNVSSDQGKGQQNQNESQEEAKATIFSSRESSNGQQTFTAMSSEHWLNTQA
ncbi:flagellar hook-length control protein FliK [Vibrio rotiferianus]|uniref:flagellar hook-length control protein FliK n=1 Tax=Vibrio rotiferianus TaxID=190895 RepID=UPI0002375666|nr:flagellar hook-length control protein FliK [Vibrio rotiferianus]